MTMKPSESKQDSTCCPKFDPAPWDDKVVEWDAKKFIQDHVVTFFFMPVNFGKVMKRLDEKVTHAGALTPGNMCLSEHTSRWNMNVYMAVDKEIAGTKNVQMSGKFYCKVYEGPFKDTGKWSVDFESAVKAKGYAMKRMFMWYTTCPKCAKIYGKNYVVIMAQV